MPRYYFHLHNSIGDVPDEEGRELPDLETARAEGLKGARSLVAEGVTSGRLDLDGTIEIADGSGSVLLIIAFAEAVGVEAGHGEKGPSSRSIR